MSKVSRNARAVVTGAASGIGRSFALELARRGGQVVVSDIDLVGAQRTVTAIEDNGGTAVAVHCDVAKLESVQELAAEACRWFEGTPTLVVNNAGVGAGGNVIGDVPIEDWEWTLGINLWGPINGCHVFAPMLRRAAEHGQPGGIINVASAASFGAAPRMAAYNVSKAGVLSLSETLAAELVGTGVKVSVLCPTFVKTGIVESGRINAKASAAASRLMQFGMSPDKVARICLDSHDRGGLYVMPQVDAKIGWQIKRTIPHTYTRVVGLLERYGPLGGDDSLPAGSDIELVEMPAPTQEGN
ncbi:SDR family NAD(P)-dependent oxidoreductase [Nocardioides marmoriginsengisoli]|uniref:SDR family NAD(P)-dependent oxidoreductase n=1 Tax=Nocardioides marmoriginsengisoli TaxID=661483 RepID=A0A3N0CBB7_9ACTN|nr:SDR family NAD(P)-dependent oxidoreductase [Nocardioides marmoriginsengisoli]RNL60541.1 SDR family NAD(P)-dependent oxidoreductase [Nocardioides marmoriginsengisoli]